MGINAVKSCHDNSSFRDLFAGCMDVTVFSTFNNFVKLTSEKWKLVVKTCSVT